MKQFNKEELIPKLEIVKDYIMTACDASCRTKKEDCLFCDKETGECFHDTINRVLERLEAK